MAAVREGAARRRGVLPADERYDVRAILDAGVLSAISVTGGFTVGDTFLGAFGTDVKDPRLLSHERRHSDWYAIMGFENFFSRYMDESTTVGRCGFLEYAAGWEAGNYPWCSL